MHLATFKRQRLAVGLLALAALVAACGSSNATASPAASAASSGAASSAPGASASAATSMEGIAIGQPYTLADLPASVADTVQAGIEKNLGAYGKAVHVAMKSIQDKGTSAAYLMVVQFPAGTLSDSIYAQVINNLSMGAESDFTPKLINGVSVSFGAMSGGSVAVFRKGDLAFITLATKSTDLTPIVSALVKVNG